MLASPPLPLQTNGPLRFTGTGRLFFRYPFFRGICYFFAFASAFSTADMKPWLLHVATGNGIYAVLLRLDDARGDGRLDATEPAGCFVIRDYIGPT
jgi:hypothetical protein